MRLRRQLAVLAVSAALVAVAGCSADVAGRGDAAGTPGASAPATNPSATASAGAPGGSAAPQLSLGPEPTAKAGGNASTICADAKKASEKGTTGFVQQLTAVLEAQGRKDKNAEQAAERRLGQVLDGWAADLRKASLAATDAQLKATLAQLAAQVDGLTSDVETIDDAALSAIQDRLDTLCPN